MCMTLVLDHEESLIPVLLSPGLLLKVNNTQLLKHCVLSLSLFFFLLFLGIGYVCLCVCVVCV